MRGKTLHRRYHFLQPNISICKSFTSLLWLLGLLAVFFKLSLWFQVCETCWMSGTEPSSIQTLGFPSQQWICYCHLWFTKVLIFFVIFIFFLLNKHRPRSSLKDGIQAGNLKINIIHCNFSDSLEISMVFIPLPIANN